MTENKRPCYLPRNNHNVIKTQMIRASPITPISLSHLNGHLLGEPKSHINTHNRTSIDIEYRSRIHIPVK